MSRILLRQDGVVRHLASINVGHDGSIKLDLVRSGVGTEGWNWSANGRVTSAPVQRGAGQRKTKSITIHTSGRVNYHFDGKHTIFLPCLMDLEGPVTVVLYSVPSIAQLDERPALGEGDHVVPMPDDLVERLSFRLDVLPAVAPPLANEICRFGVEGLFALACVVVKGDGGFSSEEGMPAQVFTTVRPNVGLAEQAIAEEAVYLRFRRAMYATDVRAAVAELPDSAHINSAEVEAMIAAGPGLYPPNGEGVWTCVTAVPMRTAPALSVHFDDARYEAHVVDFREGDTRLATVRVRFRVFDKRASAYEKKPVSISRITFNAEL